MTTDDGIRIRSDGAVRWLVLDRPLRRNALGTSHRTRLVDEIAAAEADPSVRCLVVTGTGPVFCAGGDLGGSHGAGVAEPDVAAMVRNAQRLVTSLLDVALPVVVAMNGDAVGMGACLALAGDVVVAVQGASFRFPFVRRGLVPDAGATHLLPRLVGPHRARALLLLGEDLGVDEAARLGIVHDVVPPERLEATAAALAEQLAAGPTVALGLTRRLLADSGEIDRATLLDAEAQAQATAVRSPDASEGLAAFAEHRPPRFTGR